MRLVRDGGEDVGFGGEEIAIVRTDFAVCEVKYFGKLSPLGPLFIFCSPRIPAGADIPASGINPLAGRVMARSLEDVRRLRDALNMAIARAEEAH